VLDRIDLRGEAALFRRLDQEHAKVGGVCVVCVGGWVGGWVGGGRAGWVAVHRMNWLWAATLVALCC
jgi:hypothetical protein